MFQVLDIEKITLIKLNSCAQTKQDIKFDFWGGWAGGGVKIIIAVKRCDLCGYR
jgi:hypothetical protein